MVGRSALCWLPAPAEDSCCQRQRKFYDRREHELESTWESIVGPREDWRFWMQLFLPPTGPVGTEEAVV